MGAKLSQTFESLLFLNPFDKNKYPNCHDGHQYAVEVVLGEIPNCKFVIGACKRYLEDMVKDSNGWDYTFKTSRAERYLRLVQKFEHVIGKWNPKTIFYSPWQKFCFMNIKGWRRVDDGNPRFRVAHVEVSRGNGKSLMASQMGLYDLALDNPVGNEIDCFATKADQARIVLDVARAMAKKCTEYRNNTGVEVLAHKLTHDSSNSVMKFLSSDHDSMDGLNSVLSIMDELHAMNRELFDVVYSGMSKRKDSLMLCITTAGFNNDSVGYTQSEYAKRVCLGEIVDEQLFCIIYTIDDGDDIYSEVTWRKANPGWGVSVDPITFRAKALKAKESPADLPNFKVKHLNIWLSEARAFFDINKWDLTGDEYLNVEEFSGNKCFVGLDLASKLDLAGYVINFEREDNNYLFARAFVPKATFDSTNSDVYHKAASLGFLTVTPGEAINYNFIEEQLRNDLKNFNVLAVHYDPWNATQFAQNLLEDGFNMVEFRMTTPNLSEPMKALDAKIRESKVKHQKDPMLRFCISNVTAKEDNNGNVFPLKNNKKLKIDLAVASIMSHAGWVQGNTTVSVYEKKDLLIL